MTIDLETLKVVIEIIGAMLASAATVLGILWKGASWIKEEFARRDKAITETREQSALIAQAANERARMADDQMRDVLSEHKLHVAETYATKAGLKESLDRVHDALDGLAQRFDVFFGGDPAPRPRPRTRRRPPT